MLRIITEPYDSILKQHAAMFAFDGYVLRVEDDALDYISDVAMSVGTGARALRSIFERIFNDVTFNIEPIEIEKEDDMKTIVVTKHDVEIAVETRYPKREVA